jgi:annexin A7/11
VQAIKKETSGHFEDALLAVVQSTCYPAKVFAQVLASSTQKVDDVSTSV